MYYLGSRLLVLAILVACPCRVCLGDDRCKSRTTVYNHLRKNGAASQEEIQRHQAFMGGLDDSSDHDEDETDFVCGSYEDDDDLWETELGYLSPGDDEDVVPSDREELDDEEHVINWEDDPVYHKLKPHVAEIVGGGLLSI